MFTNFIKKSTVALVFGASVFVGTIVQVHAQVATTAAQNQSVQVQIQILLQLVATLQQMLLELQKAQGVTPPTVADSKITFSASPDAIDSEKNSGVITLRWNTTNVTHCNLFERSGEFNSREVAKNLPTSGTYQYQAGWKDRDYTPIRLQMICPSTYQDGKDRNIEKNIEIKRKQVENTQSLSLVVKVNGNTPAGIITGDPDNNFEITVYPMIGSKVSSCAVMAKYERNTIGEALSFSPSVQLGDYGRVSVRAVSQHGALKQVFGSCIVNSKLVTIGYDFEILDSKEKRALTVKKNGQNQLTSTGLTKVQALSFCQQEVETNPLTNTNDILQCLWGDTLIKEFRGGKG